MCNMYRSTSIVYNFQVDFLFLLINIFIFYIDIVYECIILRCRLLKINLLTLLTNHDTEKQNSKHKRNCSLRNLLASASFFPGSTPG